MRAAATTAVIFPYLSGDQLHQQIYFAATGSVATIAFADIDAAGIAVAGVTGVALGVIAAIYSAVAVVIDSRLLLCS